MKLRPILIAAVILALAATGVAIGGGTELQDLGKSADSENALQMIDEQLALFDEAGVSKSEERYQELIRQRETILSSESKKPTPADEAVAALGGHQSAPDIPSNVGDCEAIPGFEIGIANPRCLSIGLGSGGYLNVYLGPLGEAWLFRFLGTEVLDSSGIRYLSFLDSQRLTFRSTQTKTFTYSRMEST